MTPTQRAKLAGGLTTATNSSTEPARLGAMNLLLHGIGSADGDSLIEVRDSLIADLGRRWSVVLSNPPFGKKSSLTMVGADGRRSARTEGDRAAGLRRHDEQQQLNFVQHIMTILDTNGPPRCRPADNVPLRGRRRRDDPPGSCSQTSTCTMLRLPTGIFYAQGVKANVLFFDKKVPRPGPERLWVYDPDQ